LRAHCKKCEAKLAKKYKYKVSLEWLEAMLAAQGGACAICKSRFTDDNRACVDHDHLTGKIRGFLCRRCNSAIGFFKDSSDLLRLAKSYILDSANNGITILFQPGWKSRVPLAIRELIFKRQGGLCKICLVDLLKIKKPCLDHDHLTGMVRGYLCDNCNSGLGYLEDLVELMESAAVYLDKNQEEIRG
jgi:Recombination endonuclease VII.